MSDRQRRYRERRKIGIKVESFEVDHGLLHEKLVGSGTDEMPAVVAVPPAYRCTNPTLSDRQPCL